MTAAHSETRRQWIHMLVGAFGLLLHWLNWWQAAILAGMAILNNFVLMPLFKIDRSFLREGERFVSGVKLYPMVVLALVVVFRNELHIAAGCWAILAVGDSVSNLFGRRYGKAKLPWNGQKSWVGTIAFVAFSFPAAFAYIWWTQAGPLHAAVSVGVISSLAAAGSVAGALAESLPVPLDDNVTIGLSSGLAMALIGAL